MALRLSKSEYNVVFLVAPTWQCALIVCTYCVITLTTQVIINALSLLSGHMQRFDMFMVEKWPLIQAFALEGIGRGSFFTMKYKVPSDKTKWWKNCWSLAKVLVVLHCTCTLFFQLMDMSEKLWRVYNRLDPVSLNDVLTEVTLSFIFYLGVLTLAALCCI